MTHTILIIDDTELNGILLQTYLQSHGYAVIVTQSGTEGLQLLAEQPVDLLLLDWVMPPPDGKEILNRLRQMPGLQQLPVIVSSAYTVVLPNEVNNRYVDFLPKPFDPEMVLEKISKIISVANPLQSDKE